MKLAITAEVRINDVISRASPTTTLRADLTRDLGGVASVSTIDKVVLVDNANNERDNACISTDEWSGQAITDGYQYSCTKEILVTENYNIAKIRLYAGTKLYFEYTLSTQYQVKTGAKVILTITIKCTFTWTHGGSVSATGVERLDALANAILQRIIKGTYVGATWQRVWTMKDYMNVIDVPVTVSYDEVNYKVIVQGTLTPDTDYDINMYAYHSDDFGYTPHINISNITLGANQTHSWKLEIQL